MTNPGDAVGTNGAYGGRTSVNAFNDVLAAFTGPGIVRGWKCRPSSGMTIALGGEDLIRDVAIAENDLGQRTTVDNISTQPVEVTLSDAPTLGSRIDAIVAYITNPPDSTGELIDSPDACGLIAVEGSVTTSPVTPTESMIREAITADGGSGVSAYYVVLATVRVNTGTNVITNTDIMPGESAGIPVPAGSITGKQIAVKTITSQNVNWATLPGHQKIGPGATAANAFTTWDTYNVPSDGRYLVRFTANMNAGNGSKTLYAQLTKNGSVVIKTPQTSNNSFEAVVAEAMVDASAGDTIAAQYRSVTAGATPFGDWIFTVIQVG